MSRVLLPGLALLAACGASPDEKKAQGPDPCKLAQSELAARLGPEFDRVVTGRRLGLAPPGGCALVYLQKDEEFAGEVEEGGAFASVDQLLAVSVPGADGKSVMSLLGASAMAPGPVLVALDGKDVDGDGTPELVVTESSGDYQGLRIFLFQGGSSDPVEIFADHLKVKTPEGLELAARWSLGQHDNGKAIVLDGAGSKKIYSWSRSEKKFVYNESATLAARPKPEVPAVPEVPVPEAPVSAAPEVKAEGKKGKAEKPARVPRTEEKPAKAAEPAKAEEKADEADDILKEADKATDKKKKPGKGAEKKEEKPLSLPDLGL